MRVVGTGAAMGLHRCPAMSHGIQAALRKGMTLWQWLFSAKGNSREALSSQQLRDEYLSPTVGPEWCLESTKQPQAK